MKYFSFLENVKVVIVLQLFKVKLIDAFFGICGSLLPQYLTKAILLGLSQVKLPWVGLLVVECDRIKSFSVKILFFTKINFPMKMVLKNFQNNESIKNRLFSRTDFNYNLLSPFKPTIKTPSKPLFLRVLAYSLASSGVLNLPEKYRLRPSSYR